MAEPTLLALVWHMHQPSYRDALSGRVVLPWTRLHATKDYGDMVSALRPHPRVHATFNLTPVLLDQLEAIASGVSDDFLDLARKPAESLTPEEQRFLIRHFFSVNPVRMLEPHPRYRELKARSSPPQGGARAPREPPLTPDEIRDLQAWFHLAWVDPMYWDEEPIRSLLQKGRGFTEAEKRSLLDWGVACAARVIGTYRDAASTGQIEIATSAYHHPILPLLISTDAPRGTWPPEGALNQEALELLREAGFAWCASDEAVLARALGRAEPGGENWTAALCRSYRVETESGALAVVFRDRLLSDRIGFVYAAWQPDRAAEDFVTRVLEAGARAREQGVQSPLVTVILDGENCWESYVEDGKPFLDALYGRISAERGIEAVTVEEALARVPPSETLPHVPVGSWIAADLSVWVGHAEKNRAWAALRRVRERDQMAGSDGGLPEDRIAQAFAEILVAEASDWFWWYGDDHQSAHKDEFDALFRSHLIRAYNLLGLPAPATIRRSLRGAPPDEDDEEHVPYVTPTLDGRDTHFYEWRNAELYDAASDQGAEHRVGGAIRRVLFGLNERDLFVRVDGVGANAGKARAIRLRFSQPRAVEALAPISRGPRGALEWTPPPGDGGGDGDAGEFVAGSVTEIRVPLSRLQAA